MDIVSRAMILQPLFYSRIACVGLALVFVMPPGYAQSSAEDEAKLAEKLKVLDLFRGTWDVTIKTLTPEKPVVTSVHRNAWVLGDRYLQGDSGLKSDGSHDLSMMTYDLATGKYPLWIFYSTGVVFALPSGDWDEATRTMVWKSPPNLLGSYQYTCVLPDNRAHRCKAVAKNWTGKVLLEQEVVAVRRAP
ncbi:DUF1579 family protein [Ferribacterium limneticum]|uniref:DUF1579 family protein n=1 Tax=Ferribacterium limneticum TaxID=76259 RepID=UPI001CF9EBFC|nr:DUF1579 family protein [Ferribacterium limneticum]UCV19801.1 DUF1579 family protein [Ferribacterium limneticum]